MAQTGRIGGAGPGGRAGGPGGGRGAPPREMEIFDMPEHPDMQIFDMPAPTAPAAPAAPASGPGLLDQITTAFANYGKGFVNTVNPIPMLEQLGKASKEQWDQATKAAKAGQYDIAFLNLLSANPMSQFAIGIGKAQWEQLEKAKKAFDEGRVSEGVGHGVAGLLPLFGPAAAHTGEKIGEGKIDEGLGEMTGILAPFGARAAMSANLPRTGSTIGEAQAYGAVIPGVTRGTPVGTPTPANVAAYADQRGIPLTAGERLGSDVIRSGEAYNRHTSPAAEIAVEKPMRARQAEAVTAAGRQEAAALAPERVTPETAGVAAQDALAQTSRDVSGAYRTVADTVASRVQPTPASPLQAADATRAGIEGRIATLNAEADAAYSALREIEQTRPPVDTVTRYEHSQMTDSTGKPILSVPITEKISMPVNLRELGVKDALAQVYAELTADPAWTLIRRQASPGFTAIEQLVRGPDAVPLSRADRMLSAIKSIAREHGGIAKLAVAKMDQAVRRVATEAGDDAIGALEKGRAATRAKYAAQEVLAMLKEEPAQAFGQLTAPRDTNINMLRSVLRENPEAAPIVARAYLDDLFAEAFKDGQLDAARVSTMATKWRNLGDQTKALLIKDPGVRRQVDDFFRQAAQRPSAMPRIPGEPVQAFRQLVANGDAGINRLRAVAKVAPEVPRQLGRAWVENVVDMLGEEVGVLSHARRAVADWRKLGPETKRLLFGDNQHNLNTFFQLLDEVGFEGNTSRTAYFHGVAGKAALMFWNPLAAGLSELSQTALARALWDPKTANALMRMMKTPRSNRAEAARASARFYNAARAAGISLPAAGAGGAGKVAEAAEDEDVMDLAGLEVRELQP